MGDLAHKPDERSFVELLDTGLAAHESERDERQKQAIRIAFAAPDLLNAAKTAFLYTQVGGTTSAVLLNAIRKAEGRS